MMNLDNNPRKSRTGRADLIRCWSLGTQGLDRAAAVLGYQREAKTPEPAKPKPQVGVPIQDLKFEKKEEGPIKKVGLHFWQPIKYELKQTKSEDLEEPAWYKDAPDLGSKAPGETPAQRSKTPLTPWSRVWPLLQRELGGMAPIGRVDVAAAVEIIARGLYLDPVPQMQHRFWRPRCRVLVDFHPRLASFRSDFRSLAAQLMNLRGREGLELFYFENGPLGLCQDWLKPENPPAPYVHSSEDMALLVLSDLGCLARDEGRWRSWVDFGRSLKRKGQSTLVLAPCPPRLWQPELSPYWKPVFWDRGAKMRVVNPPAVRAEKGEWEKGVARLLDLLAPAVRVEPELLRDVRFVLPQGEVDVAAESAIAQHPHTRDTLLGFDYHPNFVENYREGFEKTPKALKETVLGLIRLWHENLAEGIREEERFLAEELTGQRGPDSHFMGSIIKAIEGGGRYANGARAWYNRLVARQHRAMWKRPELVASYLKIKIAEGQAQEDVALPPGFDPGQAPWALGPRKRPAYWTICQKGSKLCFLPGKDATADVGSPLASLQSKTKAWIEGEERILVNLKTGEPSNIQTPGVQSFVVHSDMEAWHFGSFEKPEWAAGIGRDEFGLFADLVVGSCTQRMRWIQPGTFLMGSPVSELEREENEAQHQVTLTQGFWLADTACSQALWQEIMGSNPSRFKGQELPVEQVIWDDVQGFLSKINERKPGLNLCLPTEAQWEYACRAGTETPFWFGDNITPEQVNYNGNHPYADGPKGLYREKTLPAKSLQRNSWGLYQMHGNVWEWCADWYGDYPAGQSIDPAGPETGQFRVLRGGRWVDDGRIVRSAFRSRYPPGIRHNICGFRFASGQAHP